MEGTKPRTVSSLGMFDLLKGIGMLAIVFAHTAELYPLGTNDVTPFAFALFAYREALMAAFFIASGYGFRKRSIRKCIEQQLKTLLQPYLYTALATTVLHAFIHHAAFGSWDAAISESAKVLGGFLLGLPHTATYFGQQFFSCGPMWYLVALMLAWVLLDVLLEIFPERYITPAVVGVTLLGWCGRLLSASHRAWCRCPTFTSAIWPRSAVFLKLPFLAEPKLDLSRPRWASSRAFC